MVMVVLMKVLLLGFDNVHCGLRKDWLYYIIKRYCRLHCNLETHPHIDAEQTFIELEQPDTVSAAFRRDLVCVKWIKGILIETLAARKLFIECSSIKKRYYSFSK